MHTSPSTIPCSVTHHFLERKAQRGLRDDVLDFILLHGREAHAVGALHLTIVERELPPELRTTRLARLARDWVVLVTPDASLLTCYRRREAMRFLKRKPKRQLSWGQMVHRRAPLHSWA